MKDISQVIPDAQAFDAALVSGLQRAITHNVTVTTQKARSEHAWKDRTHATRDSIEPSVTDSSAGASGEVAAGINAERLNDGTRPHRIEAHDHVERGRDSGGRFTSSRRAGMLRFQVGGHTVFARAVNHPGTTGDHFLDAAADAAGEDLMLAVEHAIDEALGD